MGWRHRMGQRSDILHHIMRGYNKPAIGGSVVLATRETYVRETTLPLNWLRCRIGMFYSLIGNGGDNEDPPINNESIPYFGPSDQIAFGISNGISTYGFTENRFIGIVSNGTSGFSSTYTSGVSPYWQLCNNVHDGAIGDGITISKTNIGNATPTWATNDAPSGTSEFATYICADITLNPTRATIAIASGFGLGVGVTNVSQPNLLSQMIQGAQYYSAEVVGGWWNGAPINMRHFHVRIPHITRRLRIHAIHAMQLA